MMQHQEIRFEIITGGDQIEGQDPADQPFA